MRKASSVFVVAAVSAVTLSNALTPRQHLVGEISTSGRKVVEIRSLADGGFVAGLARRGEAEIIGLDDTGAQRWTTALPGDLVAIEPSRNRVLVSSVESDDGTTTDGHGRVRASVLDQTTGVQLRSFPASLDMDFRMSYAGDAVAFYVSPDENPSTKVTVRRTEGGDFRVVTLDRPVASAVPVNYQQLVVLLDNGRVDFIDGAERKWSVRVAQNRLVEDLQLASDPALGLVAFAGGAFAVMDLRDGSPVYHYSPYQPETALKSLGLLEVAKRAIGGVDAAERLNRLAANLKPSLAPDGTLFLTSKAEIDGIDISVDPKTGRASRLSRFDDIRSVLISRGEPAPLDVARNRSSRNLQATGRAGLTVVAGKQSILIFAPRR